MSIKSFEAALSFLPEPKAKASPVTRAIAMLAKVGRGLGDGLRAARHYDVLVGRGMHPSEAARTVLIGDMHGR